MTRSRRTPPGEDADRKAERAVEDVSGEPGERLHAVASCVCTRCAEDRERRTA